MLVTCLICRSNVQVVRPPHESVATMRVLMNVQVQEESLDFD